MKFSLPVFGSAAVYRALCATAFLIALSGCDTFLGNKEDPPLPGTRIPILVEESSLSADSGSAGQELLLPPPTDNPTWPQAGGIASHAMHHIAVGGTLGPVWRASIGAGNDDEERIMTQPVAAAGRVFTMDAETVVSAFDQRNGKLLWRIDLTPESEEDEGHIAGGIAYDSGRLYVTTGFAYVYALNAQSGRVQWHRDIGEPMRAPPTVRGNRVFVVTLTNKLFALNGFTGETLWSHTAIEETTGLLGGPAPAVDSGVVVAAFSSGELAALRVENGRELWSDSLTTTRRASSVATLAAIRGRPIIDRNIVIGISNSGLLAAIDLRTGRRIWDREIGGVESPWVAGDYIFLLSSNAELVAVGRRDGRIYWVRQLPLWEDPEDRTGRLLWTGPILISDRLIVAGSSGEALAVSPYTGEILGREEMPDKVTIGPIAAGNTLYFLTEDGELVAYR